jgi:hypothetical protein
LWETCLFKASSYKQESLPGTNTPAFFAQKRSFDIILLLASSSHIWEGICGRPAYPKLRLINKKVCQEQKHQHFLLEQVPLRFFALSIKYSYLGGCMWETCLPKASSYKQECLPGVKAQAIFAQKGASNIYFLALGIKQLNLEKSGWNTHLCKA